MKKIILFIGLLLLFACKSDNTEIKQEINTVDRENNIFSITTYFNKPYNYNSYVTAPDSTLDSIKDFEMKRAKAMQNIGPYPKQEKIDSINNTMEDYYIKNNFN